MSHIEWGKVITGAADKLYGIQRAEGDFSELAGSYVTFLARAQKGVHAAFPHLPPELFTNHALLAKLRDLQQHGGEVEVVCLQSRLERSRESIEALQGVGATVYARDGLPFNPFTVVDEGSAVLHRPAGFSKTRWEQIAIGNTMTLGAALTRDYLGLRDNAVALQHGPVTKE